MRQLLLCQIAKFAPIPALHIVQVLIDFRTTMIDIPFLVLQFFAAQLKSGMILFDLFRL